MKKGIVGGLIAVSCLFGDVANVLPYAVMVDYDSSSTKSLKDKSKLYGVHASIGNLGYLLEADYAKFKTEYKDAAITDLDQDDIVVAYSKYYTNFMFKVGDHYINTNDPLLKDGNVMIAAIGGWKYRGYDKFSYGVEGYYSTYSDGQDENNSRKSISIVQFTPYISFYKVIDTDTTNTFTAKLNYEVANDYLKEHYLSLEISNTLYYKKFFTTLKYYGGEMRTGVKDGGLTVMNTLDLMKNGFNAKIGYYFNKNTTAAIGYGRNNYQEFDAASGTLLQEGTNSVAVATFSYSF